MKKPQKTTSQRQRFIDAARKAETVDDPEAFKERLKKLVKAPPPASVQERKTKKPTK